MNNKKLSKKLSIIIPANTEEFLSRTVEDILEHIEDDTEIIAVLDGKWANPPIKQHERVNVINLGKTVGQRAATNIGVKMSKAKYVMKMDAHCSIEQGMDRKMIAFMDKYDNKETPIMSVPVMGNLHAFNWVCEKCGETWYQSPTPNECKREKCTSKEFKRDIVWRQKPRPMSKSYCFDSEPHFQYFNQYLKRPETKDFIEKNGYSKTMSLQGSCFMISRENYWKYEVCDEKAGSWGNQGLELALSMWLSGGRVLVNHNTVYWHLFRTQGGDFSFPYHQSGRAVQKTKKYIKDKFWQEKHPKQIHSVKWLVEKFSPVKGWGDEDLRKL